MKKVAIISELNLDNVNYGNRLQAFALNYYINNFLNIDADSLIFQNPVSKKITNKYLFEYGKLFVKRLNLLSPKKKIDSCFEKRLARCNSFTMNNIKTNIIKDSRDLINNKDYNYFIVGSDVVWAQFNNGVNRNKFLDFDELKDYKRISYAASFGKNWIPDENKKYITEQLNKFDFISVREQSIIQLLKDINVNNTIHVCDPTLLLDAKTWKNIEYPVQEVSNSKYIFTYLLGKSETQREKIRSFANNHNLLIVNIPDANMVKSEIDNNFADISINNCSPEQWLWLIDNSQFVITDSFHGCVFSNIFNKKFFILKREYSSNINIRMEDFLKYLGESDKFISINDFNNSSDNLKWNYEKTNIIIEQLINESKNFLGNALDVH